MHYATNNFYSQTLTGYRNSMPRLSWTRGVVRGRRGLLGHLRHQSQVPRIGVILRLVFQIGQRRLEQHGRNILSIVRHGTKECTMVEKEMTDLLAVPRGRTHTQSPILDSTRRKVIEDDVIGNGEDGIIVEASGWSVIPSWDMTFVPSALRIVVDNHLVQKSR